MPQNIANEIENSVDPDQTAPRGTPNMNVGKPKFVTFFLLNDSSFS